MSYLLPLDAACSNCWMVFIHVLKVLNSKVAEEMDIVETHLAGLTGMYYF